MSHPSVLPTRRGSIWSTAEYRAAAQIRSFLTHMPCTQMSIRSTQVYFLTVCVPIQSALVLFWSNRAPIFSTKRHSWTAHLPIGEQKYLSWLIFFYLYLYLQVNCIQDTNNITLHAKNLTIIEEKIKVKLNHEKLENVTMKYDHENDFLSIFTSQNFYKGNKYLLYIPFEAPLSNTSLHGYYLSSYHDKQSSKRKFLSVTQFEPISARTAFPCKYSIRNL